jgi:four helix bundle protein
MQRERQCAKTFRDLIGWHRAHEFVVKAYQFTSTFPKSETHGLALQMKRAAVTIPSNISEGFARRGKADKARFMNIAQGLLEESRYCLFLAQALGYGQTGGLMESLEKGAGCCMRRRSPI